MNVLDQSEGSGWVAYHGDCAEVLRALPTESGVQINIFQRSKGRCPAVRVRFLLGSRNEHAASSMQMHDRLPLP